MCLVSTSHGTARRPGKFPRPRRAAPRRTSYHHGDLREALLKAAVELVEELGPDGFTLREAARKVGVTHTAPYRHFADRDALLVAAMARLAGLTEPRQRLQALGIAYVEYAVAHPSHFRVMHGGIADACSDPAFVQAKAATFGLLLEIVGACEAAGLIPAGSVPRYALSAWATVHGLAELLISGVAHHMGLANGSVEAIAHEVTANVISGLRT
jgi:AcrR family transcriptional regulator